MADIDYASALIILQDRRDAVIEELRVSYDAVLSSISAVLQPASAEPAEPAEKQEQISALINQRKNCYLDLKTEVAKIDHQIEKLQHQQRLQELPAKWDYLVAQLKGRSCVIEISIADTVTKQDIIGKVFPVISLAANKLDTATYQRFISGLHEQLNSKIRSIHLKHEYKLRMKFLCQHKHLLCHACNKMADISISPGGVGNAKLVCPLSHSYQLTWDESRVDMLKLDYLAYEQPRSLYVLS